MKRGPVAAPLVQIGASDKGMWVLTLSHCPIPRSLQLTTHKPTDKQKRQKRKPAGNRTELDANRKSAVPIQFPQKILIVKFSFFSVFVVLCTL